MKTITASTIGNLISAHMEGDSDKFLAFANFIAESYEEAGDYRSARIIRKHIDGSYKYGPQATLDGAETGNFEQSAKAKVGTTLDDFGSLFLKGMSGAAEVTGKFFSGVGQMVENYAKQAEDKKNE